MKKRKRLNKTFFNVYCFIPGITEFYSTAASVFVTGDGEIKCGLLEMHTSPENVVCDGGTEQKLGPICGVEREPRNEAYTPRANYCRTKTFAVEKRKVQVVIDIVS